MTNYIIRRILYAIPTILIISIISFAVIQAPAGDYVTSQISLLREQYGEGADDQIKTLRIRYNLDAPIYVKYGRWIWNIVTEFNFGYSMAEERPVKEIIAAKLPYTVLISFFALILSWIIAIPVGIYSAVKQHKAFDYIATFFAFFGKSVPAFLLGIVVMYFFYTQLGWGLGGLFSEVYSAAPWSWAKFFDLLRHLLVPVIILSLNSTAGMIRTLRGLMLDELNKQYIQSARARGIAESTILWKHALKVSILPILSTLGSVLPKLVSGTTIISIVLNLPTTGTAMFDALLAQDMYVAGGFVFLLSTLTILGTLISDILMGILDPRIHYS